MRNLSVLLGALGALMASGCGSNADTPPYSAGNSAGSARGDAGGGGDDAGGGGGLDDGGPGGVLFGDATLADGPRMTAADPQTCDQAAQAHSYIGCDYWPTVVANVVWSIFDFAVVVANAGDNAANVTVTGPSGTNQTATVPAGQLVTMYLPWVPALKGADSDNCGGGTALASSVRVNAGAFHLVSSVPVTVYQFNALEYVGKGGPPGKNWGSCPGNTLCTQFSPPVVSGCYSFSNDASLLLPSTAMTGDYRVAGHEGAVWMDPASGLTGEMGAYMAITGTQNGTTVKVKVSGSGQVLGGTGITATGSGGTMTFTLDAGDVVELVGPGASDLSGSQVQATAPVQVITGMPCTDIPPNAPACDHMEESVFPEETLGKDYVVTRPAGPNGNVVPHRVRIYGDVDGTRLTYNPATPAGCPAMINAGQVVECGGGSPCPATADATRVYNCGLTNQDFEVKGDHPFAVGMFTLGASIVDPNTQPPDQKGDPAQSFATAVEQYRTKYVFLAPADYTVSYVDIVAATGTTMTLDGQNVTAAPQSIGSTGYSAYRVRLGNGQAGAHVLEASQAVGIQVVGYGAYTSYMYPGGLDLLQIAPPPPPLK
jgi:hypothetical protein